MSQLYTQKELRDLARGKIERFSSKSKEELFDELKPFLTDLGARIEKNRILTELKEDLAEIKGTLARIRKRKTSLLQQQREYRKSEYASVAGGLMDFAGWDLIDLNKDLKKLTEERKKIEAKIYEIVPKRVVTRRKETKKQREAREKAERDERWSLIQDAELTVKKSSKVSLERKKRIIKKFLKLFIDFNKVYHARKKWTMKAFNDLKPKPNKAFRLMVGGKFGTLTEDKVIDDFLYKKDETGKIIYEYFLAKSELQRDLWRKVEQVARLREDIESLQKEVEYPRQWHFQSWAKQQHGYGEEGKQKYIENVKERITNAKKDMENREKEIKLLASGKDTSWKNYNYKLAFQDPKIV
jgi:hypothetical protein